MIPGPQRSETLLVAVVGPTASGKSSLAVSVARVLGGEIVNCDSMQLYRKLEIGTAKPSHEERRHVRHHLYDVIEPEEVYSAGRYMIEARAICSEIAARGNVPVIVGGTGLYLNALIEGVFEGPGRSEEIRARLHKVAVRKGSRWLHAYLRGRDPVAAAKIQPADRTRIIRALEVFLSTGKPISSLHSLRNRLDDFRIVKVGLNLPRSELYARINRRVEWMYDTGLVQEVERLLAEGFQPEIKAFEALGYRHVLAYLHGTMSLEEARELTARDTRRYAKRQLTWFRRDSEMHWIVWPGEDKRALDELLEIVKGS